MQHYKTVGPTLTNMTRMGRSVVKFGSIALAVMIFGRMLLTAGIAYWKATHPEPPPPPTVGFGILPSLRFPDKMETEKPTSYRLELPTGRFAEFPDRAQVLFMPRPAISLLSDQRAKEVGAVYGFQTDPEIIGVDQYRWTGLEPLVSTFDLNIEMLTFDLETDYLSRPELLLETELPDGIGAVKTTKTFLGRAELLPPDVATSPGEIVYKKSLGGELVDAVSVSDADFISVDITRYPIEGKYRMYTPGGLQGTIHTVLSNGVSAFDGIVSFDFFHHQVDYTLTHTYPLRPVAQAWEMLQAGQGFVAEKGVADVATIREVELGYYDDFEYQQYLQPIYVFKGDGFIGYVSAIDSRWVTPPNPNPVP